MASRSKQQRIGGLGWRPSPPDWRDLSFAVPPTLIVPNLTNIVTGEGVDPSVPRGLVPDAYSQLQLGSCVLNAVAGTDEFAMRRQGEPDFMPSRLFMYWNTRFLENTVGYDSGATNRDALKALATWGVCPETEWPYDPATFTDKPSASAFADASTHTAVQYLAVPQTATAIQASLAQGWPVLFGFSVYSAFEGEQIARDGILHMPGPSEQGVGGHGVGCWGLDFTARTALVRNSWGSSWGLAPDPAQPEKRGYFTMPFDYLFNPQLADDFWTLRRVS